MIFFQMPDEKVEFVVFDWSGTVSKDLLPVYQANNLMCEHYGLPTIPVMEDWLKLSVGRPHEFFQARGVTQTPAEIWALYEKYFNKVIASGVLPTMYDDVPEVLDALQAKGKKLAIVSSHPSPHLFAEAQRYGIMNRFIDIIGSATDKSSFITIMRTQLGINREHTIYVGDMVSDIKASQKAGVRPFVVTRGYHSKEMLEAHNPHAIMPDLRPLISILR